MAWIWTDETKAEAIRLYREGKSASKISAVIAHHGRTPTRDAVIGVIHRAKVTRSPDAKKASMRNPQVAKAPRAAVVDPRRVTPPERSARPQEQRIARRVKEAAAVAQESSAVGIFASPNRFDCRSSTSGKGGGVPAPIILKPAATKPTALSRVLAELDVATQCRFPVGRDPGPGRMADQLLCGQSREPGEIYCPACRRLSYRTPETAAKQNAAATKMREHLTQASRQRHRRAA